MKEISVFRNKLNDPGPVREIWFLYDGKLFDRVHMERNMFIFDITHLSREI